MPRSLLLMAARTGAGAAATGAAVAVSVAVLCWLPDAGVSGRALATVRAGLLGFLAAQHAGITIDGVPVAFLPLGILVLVGTIAWRAGGALAASTDDDCPVPQLAGALAVQALAYACSCALLVPVADLGTSGVAAVPTGFAAAMIFALFGGAGLVREHPGLRIPVVVQPIVPACRAAAAAVAVLVGAGALLVAGALVAHAGTVTTLSGQVGGGLGGIPVLVLGILAAPNAAVAGASYLVGPGFAVGTGTTVSAFSASHGVLPAFPLLGAVPGGAAPVPVLILMIAAVLGAGAAAGAVASRTTDLPGGLRCAAGAGLGTGIAMALLAWQAGGALGDGRLRAVGASPWQVGLVTALEVSLIAVLVVAGVFVRRILDARTPSDASVVEEPELVAH